MHNLTRFRRDFHSKNSNVTLRTMWIKERTIKLEKSCMKILRRLLIMRFIWYLFCLGNWERERVWFWLVCAVKLMLHSTLNWSNGVAFGFIYSNCLIVVFAHCLATTFFYNKKDTVWARSVSVLSSSSFRFVWVFRLFFCAEHYKHTDTLTPHQQSARVSSRSRFYAVTQYYLNICV